MKIWNSYTQLIKRNCANKPDAKKNLSYWRNNLFAGIIIYLLPFCFVALIPSLYFVTVVIKQYGITLLDLGALICILIVAFLPGISILVRKIIFIVTFHLFSVMILYYTGVYGGGFIYLQAASIFLILIFPSKYAYWTVLINIFICLMFGFARSWSLLPWPGNYQTSLGAWVAVSSNLIFLTLLEAALIPKLFTGLEQTIEKETQLQLQSNSQQKLLEQNMQMLELKNNELEQFAYVASHDLQEPLRMITSFLSLLEKKYSTIIDDKGKEYIAVAKDGAVRMRQIIIDLLEYSRAGRNEAPLEEVDLNELINEIKILYKKQIEEKQAVLISDLLPVVHLYRSPMRQVFQNLISNALKYTKPEIPLQIKIKVKDAVTHWQFAISDNGIGILPENYDKIFIIFQRLHTKAEYAGTGIGLALVKKIVDNLGGKIWVASEEGKGSTFYFTVLKNKIQ